MRQLSWDVKFGLILKVFHNDEHYNLQLCYTESSQITLAYLIMNEYEFHFINNYLTSLRLLILNLSLGRQSEGSTVLFN